MKVKRFWKWYIQGEYHCDQCPYCWDDASPAMEDCDCGCYIFGDLRDSCRLLPPFRFLLGWGRKRKAEYSAAHEWDDYASWMQEIEGKEAAFYTALRAFVQEVELTSKTTGSPCDPSELIEANGYSLFYQYEDRAHPFQPKPTLKQQWSAVFRATGDAAKEQIRPFLPRKKKKAYCPHCKKRLRRSRNIRYKYECRRCDEDFYNFEVLLK